ncbi:metal ABC transporter solute-binding protein, Zn/Mn family [Moraxella marmotae]|uniref:metal ABC transporter solute-binding protein, Zn/Mn family n=1 Tax=Moraxella marmotae TaxID=3344520 RepID=UPI0035D48F65
MKIKSWLKGTLLASLLAAMPAVAGVVSVSNYPLALLSHAVTQGNQDAEVLLETGDVGHHGSLSPSKVKLVKDSDYVVWFGEAMEQNLAKPLQDAPNAISLLKFNAFHRLPLRQLDGQPRSDSEDAHIWLDPENAKAIVRALAVIHGYANPENKAVYQKNAADFEQRMDAAVQSVKMPTKLPYWAYHDAYQYIEQAAGLTFAGALTPDHHLNPKASQFKKLNSVRPKPAMCLISQGRVSDGVKNKLGNVKVEVLQEDMSGGSDDFIEVWKSMVATMQQCAK